jgi:hypothetical protein
VSAKSLQSFRFAPSTTRPIGIPRPSVNRLRLVPRLARSVGFGPVFFPAERSLGHRPVHREPLPVDPFQLVVSEESAFPERAKHSSLSPLLKSAVGRRRRADAGGFQCIPRTAGPQDKQNRGHGGSVIDARSMTSKWMRLAGREQRLHLRPNLIRNPPAVAPRHEPHANPLPADGADPIKRDHLTGWALRIPRKRFIQLCVRSTTQRRAR